MRCSQVVGSLLYSSALLLPLVAAADSQLESGSHGPLTASAHVRFRVIIPAALSLDTVKSAVAITSNSRNVALTTTVGARGDAKGRVLFSAAARKIIAQDAPCTPAPGDSAGQRVICTVSMP